MSSPEDLPAFLAESRSRVDRRLDEVLPPASEPPALLHEAMRYAVFSGGKRLRPALAFGAALACGRKPDLVLPVAVAAELLHAYSLVHDDLPAMDDDQERRGRPTVHIRFGEAGAILAGDALLACAFAELARDDVPQVVTRRLACVASSRQLVGGQADDLMFQGRGASLDLVTSIHERKTAALFGFSVWGAARLCGASDAELASLDRFARDYGLAFQAADDLRDADPGECSILRVLSVAEARREVERHVSEAVLALDPFGSRAAALRGLAEGVAGRLT